MTSIAPIIAVALLTASRQQPATTQPSESDIRLVARVVYAEAAGEPMAGKTAVASVIYNRSRARTYPRNVSGVVFQKNAFSCISPPSPLWLESASASTLTGAKALAWRDSLIAARYATTRASTPAIASRVTTCKVGASYFDKLTPCGVIGRHTFYVDKRP